MAWIATSGEFRAAFPWLAAKRVIVDDEATNLAAAAVTAAVYLVAAPVGLAADPAVVAVAVAVVVAVVVAVIVVALRVLGMPAVDFAPAAAVVVGIQPVSAFPAAHLNSRDMDGFQVLG